MIVKILFHPVTITLFILIGSTGCFILKPTTASVQNDGMNNLFNTTNNYTPESTIKRKRLQSKMNKILVSLQSVPFKNCIDTTDNYRQLYYESDYSYHRINFRGGTRTYIISKGDHKNILNYKQLSMNIPLKTCQEESKEDVLIDSVIQAPLIHIATRPKPMIQAFENGYLVIKTSEYQNVPAGISYSTSSQKTYIYKKEK